MQRRVIGAFLALWIWVAAGAKGEEQELPSSSSARAAIQKYEKAAAQAKADFDKVLKDAQSKAIADLDRNLKEVMRKGDLEEANRIRASMDRITGAEEAGANQPTVSDMKGMVNRKLVFFRIEPGIGSMTLSPDGAIAGFSNKNESSWKLSKDGSFQFIGSDGSVTSEFRTIIRMKMFTCLIGRSIVTPERPLVGLMTIPAAKEDK